jgi:predicted O-methyltransferase YrrM
MSLVDLSGMMADRRYPDPGFNVNYLAMFLAFQGTREDDMAAAASLAEAQAQLEGWKNGVTVPQDAGYFLRDFWKWADTEGLTAHSARHSDLLRELASVGIIPGESFHMSATEIAENVYLFQQARYAPYRRMQLDQARAALGKDDLGHALACAVEARKFDTRNAPAAAVVEDIRQRVSTRLPRVAAEEMVRSIRAVDGWFSDADARLLARCVAGTPHESAHLVVEIGSYKGRSTTLIGLAVRQLSLPLRIITIDPHAGYPFGDHTNTYDTLISTLRNFGLLDQIEVRRARSLDVRIDEPVALAFIDGLHDPESVSADVHHVLGKIAPGGLIAMHDYSDHFPGVIATARTLLEHPAYEPVGLEDRFLVVRKRGTGT